jgi:hypothetical protein
MILGGTRLAMRAGVRSSRPAAILLTLLTLAGCGAAPRTTSGTPSGTPATGNTPGTAIALTLGAPGDGGALDPLDDGAAVTLVPGAQGGFHVWLAYRLRDVPAGTFTLERDAARVSDGAVVLRYRGDIAVTPASDGSFVPDGPVPMFMCPAPIGISIIGVPIAYRLRLIDGDGQERAGAGVTLVARCPDDNAACPRICSGE